MEEKTTGKKYRMTRIALYLIGAAVFLQIVEYVIKQQEIEFRIYIQTAKGIFLWLVVPITTVFAIYHDFFREKSKVFWRYLVPTILTILIAGASLFRGLVFFFSEMITEETMEDGMIRGELSTLFENRYIYYEPVAGIFRTPFQGWSDEKVAETLKERYGDGILLVGTEPSGDRIYQVPADGPGKDAFYFCVWNGYEMRDNYLESLIKTDAAAFGRMVVKADRLCRSKGDFVEIMPDGQNKSIWSTEDDPQSQDRLLVTCYSVEDVKFCAADLTDWILYVLEDRRYPDHQESDSVSFSVSVRFSNDKRRELSFAVKRKPEENEWTGLSREIEEKLMNYAEEYTTAVDASDADFEKKEELMPEEELAVWEEEFLGIYQGDYEKEVFLSDNMTGYRMVVLDAALGSRMYGLLKSTDGGESWKVASRDPFGESGMGIDFTFLDESFGFATLMHNGGDEADLFVTENGGKSYERCVMQGFTVTLDDGYVYDPYDYPQMPYEENGKIYVLCGQGTDGDYDGGDEARMAMYESTDHGHTFVFREMKESAQPEG